MGKKILISLVVIMAAIIVTLVAIVMTFNLNKYKPQIEKKVYEATGKELKIQGKIGLSLSPFGISAKDIVIKNPKGFSSQDMLKLGKVAISLQLAPLLNKQIKINYVKLININLLVEKSKKGILNLALKKKQISSKPAKKEISDSSGTLPMVNVGKVLLENVNIIYKDHQTNTKANVNGLNLSINNIALSGDKDILKALSLKGLLTINNIKYDRYLLKNISANFKFKDKIATIDPMKLTTFNSTAIGKLIYNMQNKTPKIYIQEHIGKFDLAEISKEFIKSKKISLNGYVKADVKLAMTGQTPKQITKSLSGKIYVVGDNFGVKGIDLNKILSAYDKTKSLNVKDVGAFMLAGPVGLALTKGADAGSAVAGIGSGETTAIKKMVINTPIQKGILILKDVALSTGKYRLAIKGKLNLYNKRFIHVAVGFLNKKGCAKISQTVSGSFSKPKVNTSKLAVSAVTGMVTSLFGQFKGLAGGKKKTKCKVFYNGSVK